MSTDPEGLTLAKIPNMGMQGVGVVSYGSDDANEVEFFPKQIHIPALKASEDGAQCDREESTVEKIYVRIKGPAVSRIQEGDEWCGEATEEHKMQYWRQWQHFESGQSGAYGFDLKLLKHAVLDEALIRDLKKKGVHNIEQLAAQPDASMPRLGAHGYTLRKAACAFLQEQQEQAALKDVKQDYEAMKAELESLRALVEQQTAPKGRARKEQEENVSA